MLVETDFKIAPCGTSRPTLAGLTPGPSLSVNSGYSRSMTSTFPGPLYATPRLPGIWPPPPLAVNRPSAIPGQLLDGTTCPTSPGRMTRPILAGALVEQRRGLDGATSPQLVGLGINADDAETEQVLRSGVRR